MSRLVKSFPSIRGDAFNNLTVEILDDKVQICVHSYSDSVDIRLSREEAKELANHILKGLPTDEEKLPILGYLPGGKRIHPIKPGMIATPCVVSCVGCHKVIRGMGGPMRGALCPDCWEAAGL